MFEVYGLAKQKALVMSNNRDNASVKYLQELMLTEPFKGQSIVIMPDYHPGSGCLIGTAMTIGDKVSAYTIGSDIGCGVAAYPLGSKPINYKMFDKFIHTNIAIKDYFRYSDKPVISIDPDFRKELDSISKKTTFKNWEIQLGSLGGGNHFIEIDQDKEKNFWLIIHTGSRGFGGKVSEFWQIRTAGHFKDSKGNKCIGKGFLDGAYSTEYYHDVAVAIEYAKLNRQYLFKNLLNYLKIKYKPEYVIETIHNYIEDLDSNYHILRKGAISGKENEIVLIPMNMRDGTLLVKAKGNSQWLESLPHGAGRALSRSDAKNMIKMSDYKDSMKGIYTSSVSKSTVDESPTAYKDQDHIISSIEDNATLLDHWKTVFNFKPSSEDSD
jgi:RNA-splicing ligase RtcB